MNDFFLQLEMSSLDSFAHLIDPLLLQGIGGDNVTRFNTRGRMPTSILTSMPPRAITCSNKTQNTSLRLSLDRQRANTIHEVTLNPTN